MTDEELIDEFFRNLETLYCHESECDHYIIENNLPACRYEKESGEPFPRQGYIKGYGLGHNCKFYKERVKN